MTNFLVLRGKSKVHAVVLGVSLGLTLSFGFQATAYTLPRLLGLNHILIDGFCCVLLSGLLFVSLPSPVKQPEFDWPTWHRSLPVPLFIAVLFGIFQSGNIFTISTHDFLWTVLVSPLSEEFLFRGWVFSITDKFYGKTMFSFANPLPTSVWVSSIAFSLWHVQNIASFDVPFVIFQMFYTFWLGLWLGNIRFRKSSIRYPLISHLLLNLASILF